jgi:hypothetical protein
MNGFDDFDSDEVDSLESWESVDTTDEPPFDDDGEPHGSYDLSDDGDALASAGCGTDEDYGYFGEDF